MVNALVVRKDRPPPQMALRAAQYVRMSTDHQRYSIVNQAAVIARARTRKLSGWMIALRLGENNEAPLDYVLLPFPSVKRDTFWFGEQTRSVGIEYFENFENLADSLVRRVSRVRSNSAGGKRPKATGPKSKRVSPPRAKTARTSRGGSRN